MPLVKLLVNYFEDKNTFKPSSEYFEDKIDSSFKKGFITSDTNQISLIYKLKNPDILSIICHGNKSNISMLAPLYEIYDELGISYLAFDYPGYGKSTGKPCEKSMYASLDAVVDFAIKKLGFDFNKIMLHGISLGGAVAIEGLRKYKVMAGVVDCTFTNNIDVPKIPVYKLLKPKFNSIEKIKSINQEMLFYHSELDNVIPVDLGKKLFEAKQGNKEFFILKNANHRDYLVTNKGEYFGKFKEFLEKVFYK